MESSIEYLGINVNLKGQKVQPIKYYMSFTENNLCNIDIPQELLQIATPFDYSIRKQSDEEKVSSVSYFIKPKYAQSVIETVAKTMHKLCIPFDSSIAEEFYSISHGYDITIFYDPIISIKNINGKTTCGIYLNTLRDKSREREHYLKSLTYSSKYNFNLEMLSVLKSLVDKEIIKIFTNAYEFKDGILVRKYYFKIKKVDDFRKEIERIVPYYTPIIDGYRLCEVSISTEDRLGFYFKPRR